MTKVSQSDRVAKMLVESRTGVCGTDFLRAYVPRYGARIHELRREGWVIVKSKCDRHVHESVQWVFEVVDR